MVWLAQELPMQLLVKLVQLCSTKKKAGEFLHDFHATDAIKMQIVTF